MRKIIFFYLILFNSLLAEDFKLEKVVKGLNKPWSLSFVNKNSILVTEKSGNIKFININEKSIQNINHNLKILEDGQGGLLDILFKDNLVFVSYSEDRSNGNSSTSMAKAKFNLNKMNFVNVFRAEPPINSGYHFGSRIVAKGKHIYLTVGDRGTGRIDQDPTKHP